MRSLNPLPYSTIFGSLAWLSLAAIIAMTAVRVTTYLRPNLADQLPLPWKRFALLGVGYVLLTDDGTIGSAINSPTSSLLIALTLGITATYIANIVRPGAESSESTRGQWFARAALAATAGHPSVLLLFGIVLAALLTSGPENGGYVGMIDSLAGWSLLFMFPLYSVRLAAMKWSIIPSVLPSPIAHSAAFAIAIVIFGQTGVLATIYEYPASSLASAAAASIFVTYAAWALRRTINLDFDWRFSGILKGTFAPASSVLIAVGSTLPLLALLNDLPAMAQRPDAGLRRDGGDRQTLSAVCGRHL